MKFYDLRGCGADGTCTFKNSLIVVDWFQFTFREKRISTVHVPSAYTP